MLVSRVYFFSVKITKCILELSGDNRDYSIARLILKLYVFFWVIPRLLNFIRRRFRTLCLFHLHRQVGVE